MRIGLVGTSRWATQVHGAGLAAHPGVDLVGVWGRDEAKAAAAAERLGTSSLSSYDALVGLVDAVAFSVPPQVQGALALQAARAGRHLLLEKPVALDPQVADAVAAEAVASVVFLTRRWEPQTAGWLAEVAAQGPWDSGRAAFVAALPEEFLDGSPWRAEHGGLWDVGPHALSCLEAVLGEVVEVQSHRGARDLVHLLLRHEGGAVSTAELCLTASPGAAQTAVEFWGPSGRRADLPQVGHESVGAAHAAAVDALLAQVAGTAAHGVGAAYGAHLTRVLAQA